MATVVIRIEDEGSRVKLVSEPSAEQLIGLDMNGQGMTAAQTYALFAVNEIRKISKGLDKGIIKIPGPRIAH